MIEIKEWYGGMKVVRISSVSNPEEFSKWLYGQTRPLLEEDDNPYDWAYYWDWDRWNRGLGVID